LHDDDTSGFYGYITSSPHGDTKMSLCESWGIIDSIPDHCYSFSFLLEFFDFFRFFTRKNFGSDRSDASCSCDSLGCTFVVSREHIAFDTEFSEVFNGASCFWSDGVCDGNYPKKAFSLHEAHNRFSFRFERMYLIQNRISLWLVACGL